jgi:hypothetical protein
MSTENNADSPQEVYRRELESCLKDLRALRQVLLDLVKNMEKQHADIVRDAKELSD